MSNNPTVKGPIGGFPPSPVFPQVVDAEVNWMEGYGNAPTITVKVDGKMPAPNECLWKQTPPHAAQNFSLTSYHEPWAQFRHINNPQDPQNFGGAMGGSFWLETGDLLTTNCGWSSRAGVFNKDPEKFGFPGHIEEVTVREPQQESGWFGYNLLLETLIQIMSVYQPSIHMVRRDWGEEPGWYPSVDPEKVVKPSGYVWH